MTKAFSREMLARAFGLFGPVLGISAVLGPVVAGFIIDADWFGLGWRPIFLLNIVLGVTGLVLARSVLPLDTPDRSTVIDGWGSGLLGVTMFGLLFGLIEGSSNGWRAVPIISMIVGVGFFAVFAYRQRTAPHPLIKPALLRNRGFTSGLLVGLFLYAAGSGLFFVLSLFLQGGLHASPGEASLGLVPLTAGSIAAVFTAMGGLVARLAAGSSTWAWGSRWSVAPGSSPSCTMPGRASACGRWPRLLSSSASALACATPRCPLVALEMRMPTKQEAPAAPSARSSNSPRRSAPPLSARSSSTLPAAVRPTPWLSPLSSCWSSSFSACRRSQ